MAFRKMESERAMEFIAPGVRRMVLQAWLVGSQETCSPPPIGSDRDILVLVENLREFSELAQQVGFTCESDIEYASIKSNFDSDQFKGKFGSFRLGDVNLIVSADHNFIDRFCLATRVAKKLSLQTRPERVTLFQAILYEKG